MTKVKSKRTPISLTLRVLLFVMLAIGISLVLSGHLILSAIQHHFMEQDAEELEVVERSIQATLMSAEEQGQAPEDALLNAVVGHHGVYFLVRATDGTLVYRTKGPVFWSESASSSQQTSSQHPNVIAWKQNNKTYRGVVTSIDTSSTSYDVVIALDMAFHKDFLRIFKRSLFLILLASGIVTLLAAWLGIYQGHLPLRSLSARIQQVKTNKLDLRLDPSLVPGELEDLVLSFNHMIERLEEGFVRLSHFSSDIAHELRTPLTNIITQTQVVMSKPRELEEYRELIYSSLEEQERLAKMVSDMLWLAKSDNDLIKLEKTPLLLADETRELFDFFDALASEKDLKLQIEGVAGPIPGDRALIRRALSNLLSNAIRHSPEGETISVVIQENNTDQTLTIENLGETIPEEHISKLFDRFYRIDPSRQRNSEGAGLGLAITKSIITAHGGEIGVKSNDGLTEFRVTLPA